MLKLPKIEDKRRALVPLRVDVFVYDEEGDDAIREFRGIDIQVMDKLRWLGNVMRWAAHNRKTVEIVPK